MAKDNLPPRLPASSGTAGAPAGEPAAVLTRSLWRVRLELAWKGLKGNLALFWENKIGVIGVVVIALFAVMAVLHPILMRTVWDFRVYDPILGYDLDIVQHPAPPSADHLLGTDPLGRDVLSQLLFSTASEFGLGIVAALVTVVIATAVGAVAAYYGGAIDTLFMRLADIVLMTPYVTILIVLSVLFNLQLIHLAVAIGLLAGFGGTAIIIKSQALTIKVRTYIEAARVAGGNDAHIIFRHIVPNLLPLSFLYMMFTVTNAIFSEAVLSFFGLLNIRMSWGLMIFTTQTAGYLTRMDTWWLIFPASLAITFLCAAFYLVGRGIDEVVNPRLRKR
jgi:peptide/nickel transport system permease protein